MMQRNNSRDRRIRTFLSGLSKLAASLQILSLKLESNTWNSKGEDEVKKRQLNVDHVLRFEVVRYIQVKPVDLGSAKNAE